MHLLCEAPAEILNHSSVQYLEGIYRQYRVKFTLDLIIKFWMQCGTFIRFGVKDLLNFHFLMKHTEDKPVPSCGSDGYHGRSEAIRAGISELLMTQFLDGDTRHGYSLSETALKTLKERNAASLQG